MDNLSLYIHIPFCASKCNYCDFASYSGKLNLLPEYLEALQEEIAKAPARFGKRRVATVYIGGGTPSLLSADQLKGIMDTVASAFDLQPNAEVSMEANPGTVDAGKLAGYRAAGINRLSMGAQASQEELLKTLGRLHRWQDVELAIQMARNAGFYNINLDLMYALPGQTPEMWQQTLEKAMELNVEHFSCYSLIVEQGTPLYDWVARQAVLLPDEEAEDAFAKLVHGAMGAAGYERYEISNYAKPGFACRHNIVYWTRAEYLGVGCAAHSLVGEERFHNPKSLQAYLMGGRYLDRSPITRREQVEECLMLGLRMVEGVSLAEIKDRYGIDLGRKLAKEIAFLKENEILELDNRRLWLTEYGMDLQNQVVLKLVGGL